MPDYKIIHVYKQSSKHPIGWLDPYGRFHRVTWGKHEKWAGEYVAEKNLRDEQEEFELEHYSCLYRDFLVCKKNWIILNCPCDDGELYIIYRKMTKKQKDYLIDYLLKLKDTASINKIMEL